MAISLADLKTKIKENLQKIRFLSKIWLQADFSAGKAVADIWGRAENCGFDLWFAGREKVFHWPILPKHHLVMAKPIEQTLNIFYNTWKKLRIERLYRLISIVIIFSMIPLFLKKVRDSF